mgnify:CR=1 FL=1
MLIVIDYGTGNLGSIANILKKAGIESNVSSDIDVIEKADRLILPGVGSFDNGMKQLEERGLIPVLNKKVLIDKTPILGICLGLQLMGKSSEEGTLSGLGWIDAQSIRFRFDGQIAHLKTPHMGWNILSYAKPHPIFTGLYDENRFYFVHSYYLVCKHSDSVMATTEYGFKFTCAAMNENILGVQFHPEKSHKFGMRLLKNFAEWEKT